MSQLPEELLEFTPSIPGLLVTEPKTTLAVNLAWSDWDGAVAAMDEMSEAAPRIAEMFKVTA